MIRPLHDNVLVRVIKPPTETAGGIALSDDAQDHPISGVVVAVGLGKMDENGQRHPPMVSVGDVVVFGKYAALASIYQFNRAEHLILLRASLDILAVVGKDADVRPVRGRR